MIFVRNILRCQLKNVNIVHRNKLLYSTNYDFLKELQIHEENPGVFDGNWTGNGNIIDCISPATGHIIAKVHSATVNETKLAIQKTHDAWPEWSDIPMPLRGDVIRQIGNELRKHKQALGKLISLEMGKILSEGIGEVQEYIDICDFALGLSRMLPGKNFPSERKDHILLECWNPLGPIGIITAFNFPVAVFGWNSAIAMVCGNATVWKSAPSTPLSSIAITKLVTKILSQNHIPPSIASLVTGEANIGQILTSDKRLPLISFTGSTETGLIIAKEVQNRFGRSLLELGGNNAVIVLADADIDMAVKATIFSCIGTAGQRCTTTRRIILDKRISKQFTEKLIKAYESVLNRIGDPLDEKTLYSPLHSEKSVESFENAITKIKESGGSIEFGGRRIDSAGFYVEPTIVSGIDANADIVQKETFAPIVYLFEINTIEEAIILNNSVSQGLSSSLFTTNLNNIFKWLGPRGSDCGIVNVNIGTSGAEIGGAFGGEKSSGGGRESGSDAWKNYMRRSTITINCGNNIPLAQGIKFNT